MVIAFSSSCQIIVRERAVQAFRECLIICDSRSQYPLLFSSIEDGLKATKDESSIHGCLLAAREFVLNTGSYLNETFYFDAICSVSLQFRESRFASVQAAALSLLPALAEANVSKFTTLTLKGSTGTFFESSMLHLLGMLAKDKERVLVLDIVANLARIVKEKLSPFLPRLFERFAVLASKPSAKHKSENINDAMCDCIAQLVKVDDAGMRAHITGFLDQLCAMELSSKLVYVLKAIYENVDDLRRVVQHRVLDILSMVLQVRLFCFCCLLTVIGLPISTSWGSSSGK